MGNDLLENIPGYTSNNFIVAWRQLYDPFINSNLGQLLVMGDAYLQYIFSVLYSGEKSKVAKLKTAKSHGKL